jgi:hypothetical protein
MNPTDNGINNTNVLDKPEPSITFSIKCNEEELQKENTIIQRNVYRVNFIGLPYQNWLTTKQEFTFTWPNIFTYTNTIDGSKLEFKLECELTKQTDNKLHPVLESGYKKYLMVNNNVVYTYIKLKNGTTNQNIWFSATTNDMSIKSSIIRYLPKFNGKIPTYRHTPRTKNVELAGKVSHQGKTKTPPMPDLVQLPVPELIRMPLPVPDLLLVNPFNFPSLLMPSYSILFNPVPALLDEDNDQSSVPPLEPAAKRMKLL